MFRSIFHDVLIIKLFGYWAMTQYNAFSTVTKEKNLEKDTNPKTDDFAFYSILFSETKTNTIMDSFN